MFFKSINILFVLSLLSTAFANENTIDNNVLKELKSNDVQIINKNDSNSNFKTTIQLIPKEEKEKIIRDKIEFLKKDIASWKEKEKALIKIKNDFESKINKNEEDIKKWEQDVNEFKTLLNNFETTMKKETTEIDIGQNLIKKDSEVITINLDNGKKIRLIKYTVFPGDSLSKILTRTLVENSSSESSLEHKIETVIKLNKNIKNADNIKVGDILYIPFFK